MTLSRDDVSGETYIVKTFTPPFVRADYGDSGGPVVATGHGRNVVIAVENTVKWQMDGDEYVGVKSSFTRVAPVIS